MNNPIIIVGGGASGILAAIAAKINRSDALILEKMDSLGKKLKITGGGRCNLSHEVNDFKELIEYYPGGGKFLYPVFNKFGTKETLDLFHSLGISTKVERGGRIFPVFENASMVVKILADYLRKLKVKIILNSEVIEISKDINKFNLKIKNGGIYHSSCVVLAVGGLSYPKTGSTGDGFKIAESLGHSIIPPHPSLVPLEVKEGWIGELKGLTLKNVEAKVFVENKEAAKKFGDLIFTHFGLSGPIILYLSRAAASFLAKGKEIKISINFKPALSKEKLDLKLKQEFIRFSKKRFKNIIQEFLPNKMVPVIIQLLKIDSDLICSQISVFKRKEFLELLTNFNLSIKKTRGFYEAEVTQGGIDLREVNPRTMESKLYPGLFFAGEILDIDGYIGGFNLQAAFSTGFLAGFNAALKSKN
ncbi:MAG: NAD(P)/FAD-dependent oxidoreductase [Armatimonadetes bacterium]|nr:NAD(P)/FAD-dependent oxidoreductase [Armatimonadota bacterium]